MTAIYGKPFLNRHGVQDKDNTWYLALRDLTTKALESGVARLRGLSNEGKFTEFAPNCLQFKALCLAYYEDLSLPSAADAYREITNSQYATSHYRWSHSVVKSIASRLPNDFLNRDNQAEGYALFKTMYERVCHLVKQGHSLFEIASLKEPVLRLEKPRNKQTALNHLKAMKQQLGVQA